jgi:exodeoxyribonuclease V alpha subunit
LKLWPADPGPGRSEDHWFRAVLESFNRFQLLSPVRKGDWGVEGLNHITARILYNAGLIRATRGWYPGRPVMVTRNDYRLGLMNGDIGIVLEWTMGNDHRRAKNRMTPCVKKKFA